MSTPGRPKGEYRSAQHEGTPVSPGRFITFEGIDGAGKSTHLAAVQTWLQARGHTVLMTREPGGTPLAEALRELVLTRPMDAQTEALLVFAARRDHLGTVIEPALNRGDTVLCDRFTDATFAYQGGGRDVPWERLAWLEQWVQGARQPDLTLWLDLPAAEAAQRRARARAADRFEAEDLAFFSRVQAAYARREQEAPQRFRHIDALGSAPEVWQRIEAALAHWASA